MIRELVYGLAVRYMLLSAVLGTIAGQVYPIIGGRWGLISLFVLGVLATIFYVRASWPFRSMGCTRHMLLSILCFSISYILSTLA